MREPLTEEDENLIKDILSELDRSSGPVQRVAATMRLTPREVEARLDAIWSKLNNGRLVVREA